MIPPALRPAIAALIVLASAATVHAQAAAQQPTVEQLKSWIALRQPRVALLRDEVKQIDARIESRLDAIIGTLKSIADTKDSGTKVARMKEDTGKRLMKTVAYYDNKRAAMKEELRSPRLRLTEEEKRRIIAVLDAKIQKRTQQILELHKSMPNAQGLRTLHRHGRRLERHRIPAQSGLRAERADDHEGQHPAGRDDQGTRQQHRPPRPAGPHLEDANPRDERHLAAQDAE